jgi:hypothetical protein
VHAFIVDTNPVDYDRFDPSVDDAAQRQF